MRRTDIAIASAPDEAKSRFWGKVLLPNENGCMDWQGLRLPSGYGQLSIRNTQVLTNRCSLWWSAGPPSAPDLQAAHSCNRPVCVAPAHLRWATGRENSADQLTHGTRARGARNSQARLTPELVRELCETYTRENLTTAAVARLYRISQASASRILNGVDWGWLGVAPGGPGPVGEKTHCKQGHEFTAENTGVSRRATGRTQRECKACKRIAASRRNGGVA